ncbi:MAG: SH3 domain-containing protein, partial [Anaerolineae bacterium]|nr:SH3 domain-containing protein [Anaerolineae bacterium]
EDWFADLGENVIPQAGTPIPDINSDDFLNMFGEEEAEEEVPDILREIGLAPPRPAATPPPAEPAANDFSSLLDDGGEDWFAESEAEEEPAEPANELPDWLTQIEEADLQAEDDFFAEMPDFDEPAQPARTPLQDIDSLLAGYDSVETSLPDTDERLLDLNPDIERLLADDTFDDEDDLAPADLPEGLVAELPDWLSEVGASVDELSAAALLRKSQKDRPIEELNDRLQALHEGGLNLGEGEDPALSPAFKSLLPGVNDAIPPAPVVRAADAGIAGDLVLTDEQREKVNRLKGMVAAGQAQGEDTSRATAIDRTFDSPFMRDVLEEEPDLLAVTPEPESAAPVRARRRPRLKVGRLLVTLLVAAAVILPFFVSALRIGDLPPSSFDANSAAFRAFQMVDQVRFGDYVLVAAEYGPTAAAELDGLTDALLRHVIERGARPVIVSGNAVGLLHANNLLTGIAQTQTVPLVANRDYFVTRYLAAGVIGTRAFVGNVASLVAYDITGQPTNLPLTTLSDFSVIVVVAERAEDVRAWAEQIAPSAGNVPLVAAVSFAAAPLAEPYVIPASGSNLTGLSGLLVGFKDAYTYREMLDSSGRPPQIIPPTATTPAPTAVPLVEVTPEATEPLETATPMPPTEIPTETLTPSITPTLPTATPSMTPSMTPTETLTPSPTPTETPLFPASFTPTPSDTPDPANAPGISGVINTGDSVNVRQGPGRSFPVVTQLPGRSTVQIIGRDGAGEWYNILMEDGTEGWISASLVTIQEPTPASSGKRLQTWRLVQVETPTPEGFTAEATAEVTSEVTAEVTPEATAEVSTPQPPAITKGDKTTALPVTMAYRDERWYSMTLGIIVIVGVIVLGAIINILRSLLTRKGRS